jgi:hypothetical protein
MGWQTSLTGELRMSASTARDLLALRPIDWYRPAETFAEYLGSGVTFDEDVGVLRVNLGWVTWRLARMMDLFSAMKDLGGTDRLVHQEPTYDAWYATGVFFVEPGRWSYVGAGPRFDVERGSYDRPAHVGPEEPNVRDVREWNEVGPLARAARLMGNGFSIETVRHGIFRIGVWTLPPSIPRTDDVLATVAIGDGGTRLTFTHEGHEVSTSVKELYEQRELTNE